MGLLSFLFSSNPKEEIERCKENIKNHQRNVEISTKNAQRSEVTYLIKGHKKNAKHSRKLIQMEKEKIKELQKKLK